MCFLEGRGGVLTYMREWERKGGEERENKERERERECTETMHKLDVIASL